MAKKRKAKSKKKQAKKQKTKILNEMVIIAIIVIIAIALAFIFYSASKAKVPAVAEVNNVKITQQDLNEIALTIPAQLRANVSDEDLLEQAINFEILRQEAGKAGISITDEEVEANIDNSLSSVGLTREDLKQSINQQNIRWDSLFNAYKKQLLSYKFLNETIMRNISVTEQEMKDFYNQYADQINISYSEIKDEINRTITIAKSQQIVNQWLEQKRLEYDIKRYD